MRRRQLIALIAGVGVGLGSLSGCLGQRNTVICTLGFLNWDRAQHTFTVKIRAGEEVLWSKSRTVPARTDDVIPGPSWKQNLPTRHPVYTIRMKIDDGQWVAETVGEAVSALNVHVHANEQGEPEVWTSSDCQSSPDTTASA